MPKRKPIQKYDTVYFKYSKENVESHKRDPAYFPKINTKGMCVDRHSSTVLLVQWEGLAAPRYIEEYRVQIKRKPKDDIINA